MFAFSMRRVFSKEVLNQFVKPLVIIKFLYKAPLIIIKVFN